MFEEAAGRYFRLWTFVGRSNHDGNAKVFGLGCHLGPGLVLTAVHVYAGAKEPTVSIDDGLWACSVAAAWPGRDIAVLRAERKLHSFGSDRVAPPYPQLATDLPRVGMQLGCMAWLKLMDRGDEAKGRTYFGQGHVAYFDHGSSGELLFALQGPTIEKGFSGGPVFSSDGKLYGVLVQAVQHAPNLSARVLQVNSMALMSPVGRIAGDISALIENDVPVAQLRSQA